MLFPEYKEKLVIGGYADQFAKIVSNYMTVLWTEAKDGQPEKFHFEQQLVPFNKDFNLDTPGVWSEGAPFDWWSSYFKAIGGWPVAMQNDSTSKMVQHPKWNNCVGGMTKIESDYTPPFIDKELWNETSQMSAGAVSQLTCLRRNVFQWGAPAHSAPGVAHFLFSPVSDLWVTLVHAASLIESGITLGSASDNYFNGEAFNQLFTDGLCKTFPLPMNHLAFIPHGYLPVVLFYVGSTKESAPSLGHYISMPILTEKDFSEQKLSVIQAITTLNTRYLKTQSRDHFKRRLATLQVFFKACGAEVD